MNYKISLLHESKIILSEVVGLVEADTAAEMGLKVRTQAFELGYSVILDWTQSTLNVSITDAHQFVPKYYDSLDKKLRLIPTVLVYHDKDSELFQFIETSWRNKGIQTHCMNDREAAIDFLKDQN